MRAARALHLLRLALCLAVVLFLDAPASADLPNWGWLGVRIRDLSEAEMEEISIRHGLREGYGAAIVEVLSDTPAARAGLRSGDLVVAVQEQPVVEVRALQKRVGAWKIGEELSLTVFREGRRQIVKARVGRMPPEMVAERVTAEFGFGLRNQRAEELAGVPVAGTTRSENFVVLGVLPGSPADRAGLRAGDRLVKMDDSELTSPQMLRELLAAHDLTRPLEIEVKRDGHTRSYRLSPPAVPETQ